MSLTISNEFMAISGLTFGTDETLKVKKLHPDAIIPTKSRRTDFGYDLYALEDTVLEPGRVTKVRTGIGFRFPLGFGGILKDRSGVATKLEVQTVAGVIDNEYTGEVMVPFFTPSPTGLRYRYPKDTNDFDPSRLYFEDERFIKFNKGDKIAQMMLIPVYHFKTEEVEDLGETDRGDKGFGSSGM